MSEASEGERLLSAAAAVQKRWPGLRLHRRPLILASPAGAVLLDAPPTHGFLPIRGKECPCLRKEGLPIEQPSGFWIFDDQGPRPAIDAAAADLYALRPGTLVAYVVTGFVRDEFTWNDALLAAFSAAEPVTPRPPAGSCAALNSTPETMERRRLLANEELLLGTALRAPEGSEARTLALERWAALRREGERRCLIAPSDGASQVASGPMFLVSLEVWGDLKGWDHAERERRIGSALIAGADLWPEFWSAERRDDVIGSALMSVLDDLAPGLPRGLAKLPASFNLAGEIIRRLSGSIPGAEPDATAAPLPTRLAQDLPGMEGSGTARAMADLVGQTEATLRLEPPHGSFAPSITQRSVGSPDLLPWVGDGEGILAKGSGVLARWAGLFSMVADGPSRGITLYSYAPLGRRGSDLARFFPSLILATDARVEQTGANAWRATFPSR
ncbi:MAG TPA: hypothetical protein VMB50_02595 [Myxococcales bacterium]|nr:hypothetical protein [Myxococcales bacterium]